MTQARQSFSLAGFQLVIFDKDGTLIDFHAMWRQWVTEQARRLEQATGLPLAGSLFRTLGFDAATGRVAPAGPLSVSPMAELRELGLAVLRQAGLSGEAAARVLATAWQIPDPVALAVPLADLQHLFSALHRCGLKIAIATGDDRAPTVATLTGLELMPRVAALTCADDAYPIKPAPDTVLALCRELSVPPAQAVVVGDNVVDLQMAHAAGAGLAIGVLSGISPAELLAPEADVLLASVAGLEAALETC